MYARFTCRTILCLVFGLSVSAVGAAPWPIVEFDAADLIACRDITPDEWQDDETTDRLIETSFSISSLLRRGSDQQVVHFLYRIESPERSLTVVDYLPKTELATSVVGKVAVEKQREGSFSIGANLSGKYDHLASGTASGAKSESDKSCLRYELLPPKELVAAAGTINRQHGVYFKLKPSKQTSLEGAKQFVCVFRVRSSWRGALIRIRCEATVKNPHGTIALPGGVTTVGSADFVSGLHLAGDAEARSEVRELVAATRHLTTLRRAYETEQENDYSGRLKKTVKSMGDFMSPVRPDRLFKKVTGKVEAQRVDKPVDLRPLALRKAIARHEKAERTLAEMNRRS